MKKIILVAFGILLITSIGLFMREKWAIPDPDPPVSGYPPLQNYRSVSIQEFKRRNPVSGNYNLEGYVTEISYCPPCPAGAVCIPCMEDYIVISENNLGDENEVLTDSDLVIFALNPIKHFSVGEKYRFSVQVLDSQTNHDFTNDVVLVGFSP